MLRYYAVAALLALIGLPLLAAFGLDARWWIVYAVVGAGGAVAIDAMRAGHGVIDMQEGRKQ